MGFGGSAESWMQQQALYELAQTRKKAKKLDIKRFAPA
jgi:plasmid maintenance system antidote protein VapI